MSDDKPTRPRTRADCLPGGCNEERPCPWYGCEHHLGLIVNEKTDRDGNPIPPTLTFRELDSMLHTCELDVAEMGSPPGSGRGEGITLEETGEILRLTKERVRQIEVQALLRSKSRAAARGLAPEGKPPPPLVTIRRKSSAVTQPADITPETESTPQLAEDEPAP